MFPVNSRDAMHPTPSEFQLPVTVTSSSWRGAGAASVQASGSPCAARSSLCAHHASPQQMSGISEGFFYILAQGSCLLWWEQDQFPSCQSPVEVSLTGTHLLFILVILSNPLWSYLEEPLAIAQLSCPWCIRNFKEKQDARHAPEDLADETDMETGELHTWVIRQSDYIIVFK